MALSATLAAALIAAGCGSSGDSPQPEATPGDTATGGDLLEGTMTRLDGSETDLSRYSGDVVLVVNTASECGFTPQFDELQALYEEHRDDGFVILGFPADDFAQEPRSDEEIADFCEANFGVEFPMFAKSAVTGPDANPLFASLPEPDFNFNKYLLDRDGELVANWGASTTPDDPELAAAIDAEL
jgi:glutathione peroxidase